MQRAGRQHVADGRLRGRVLANQELERRRGRALLPDDEAQALIEAKAAAAAAGGRSKRVKRKVALLVSYCGSDFRGLQLNVNTRTVEAEVEKAVFFAQGISAANFGFFQKVGWTRYAPLQLLRTLPSKHAHVEV